MNGGRGLATILGLALLASASPLLAGTIYRCDGADGVPSYVSKRISGARCTAVTSYRPAPVPARALPAPAAAGSAAPSNTVAGSSVAPVSASLSVPAGVPVPVRSPAATHTRRLQQGQVYSYVKDGVRHYTSARPRGADAGAVRTIRYSFFETCFACGAAPGVNFGTLRLNTTAYADEVRAASRRFGVEEAVIRAIMHAESAFNPNALSRAGAQGLMQLMPATARRFGVANAYDPAQNIRGGVEYLAWLLRRYDNNLTLAAAGYNAGEGAVDRHKGVPPYSETQRYVQRVAVLAERYRGHVAAN